MAPIIKQSDDGERELVMRSWGFILVRAGYAPKRVTNTRDDKVQTKFGKPIDAVRRLRRLQLESWQGHKAEQFIAGKLKNRENPD
jgi:hypothetical protein